MAESKQPDTNELLTRLFMDNDLEHFLHQNASACVTISFAAYLNDWCRRHREVPEQVIRRADLEKSFGHQLFTGKRNPSRDTVLQLAFAMQADFDEAQEMLRLARKSALYPRIRRDCVVIYCLHNRISLTDAQITLHDLGLPLLGGRES